MEKSLATANGKHWRYGKGYEVRNGRRVQKFFNQLGKDKAVAERIAGALELAWRNETAVDQDGKKVWSQQSIEAAMAFAQPQPAPPIPAPPPVPIPVSLPVSLSGKQFTISEGLDDYLLFLDRRLVALKTKSTSQDHVRCVQHHLKTNTVSKKDHRILADIPLNKVSNDILARLKEIATARPATRRARRNKHKDKPISIDTVFQWLRVMGGAFEYFKRDYEKYGWKPSHDEWRENFRLARHETKVLVTPDEMDESDRKSHTTYTIAELTQLYARGTKLYRRYILMGLTLGWLQSDIATFRKSEYVKAGKEYFIDRRRQKTGVPAMWWICPELAELINLGIAETPEHQTLALTTENNLPLKHGKTDTIAMAWGMCKQQTIKADKSVRNLPFKCLRKTGAQIIQNLCGMGGEYMAQLFLAHKPQTVARQHYINDENKIGFAEEQTNLERLHDLERKMHQLLQPMFDAAIARDNKKLPTMKKEKQAA